MRKSFLVIAISLVIMALFLGGAPTIEDAPSVTESKLFSVGFSGEQENGQPETEDAAEAVTEETVAAAEPLEALPGNVGKVDMALKNRGTESAYVFVELCIPVFEASELELEKDVVVREDGLVPVLESSPALPWTLVVDEISEAMLHQVYCWSDPDVLKPGESTEPLFQTWRVLNCRVRGGKTGQHQWIEIAEACNEARVTSYAIQSNLPGMKEPDALTIWKMVK